MAKLRRVGISLSQYIIPSLAWLYFTHMMYEAGWNFLSYEKKRQKLFFWSADIVLGDEGVCALIKYSLTHSGLKSLAQKTHKWGWMKSMQTMWYFVVTMKWSRAMAGFYCHKVECGDNKLCASFRGIVFCFFLTLSVTWKNDIKMLNISTYEFLHILMTFLGYKKVQNENFCRNY